MAHGIFAILEDALKILLINLDRSTERLSSLNEQMIRLGLSYQRIPAVDAKKFSAEDIMEFDRISDPLSRISVGDIACSLSHLECMKIIANGSDEYVAVLEDDVILSNDAFLFLSNYTWIPQETHIVKLETFRNYTLLGEPVNELPNNRVISPLLSVHNGTAAYIVSKEAARIILDSYSIDKGVIDTFIFGESLKTLDIKQVYPAVAIQSNAGSIIAPTRKGIKQKRKIVREVKRILIQTSYLFKSAWLKVVKGQRWGKIPFVQ